MKQVMLSVAVALMLLMPRHAAGESKGDTILGHWYTENRASKVEVFKTPEGKYSGKIIWLKEPIYEEGHVEAGKLKHDRFNPDAAKRSTPIIGLEIVSDFTFDGSKEWEEGRLYDPETGKTYKCIITFKDNTTLNLRGYIGFPALGRDTAWTRVPEEEREPM